MKTVFTKSLPNIEASNKLAREIVDLYLRPNPDFHCVLEGGLGAGKTHFIRTMLAYLGVEEVIASPTYSLVNTYGVGDRSWAHFDFYRLEEPHDFFARGFQEIAEDSGQACFIEWPDKISPEAQSTFTGKRFILQVEFGIGVGMRKVKLLKDD